MFQCRKAAAIVLLVTAGLFPAAQARAEVFGDVLAGLDFAGFQFAGQRNPLSDGLSVSGFQNFNNTVLDFGATELTLTGPVGAQVTTGNRGFRTLDFQVTAGNAANPLVYSLISDVGGSDLNVTGSTVMDINGSINQFGWYDMRVNLSSRQSFTSSGRFANSDGENLDFDIGPIDVSGNIFADALATLTDPLFEAAGLENIFASFSGRTARESALKSTVSELQAKVFSGQSLSESEVNDLVRMAATSNFHGDAVPSLAFLDNAFLPQLETTTVPQRVAPEPSTLLLLLAPACLLRRRRAA